MGLLPNSSRRPGQGNAVRSSLEQGDPTTWHARLTLAAYKFTTTMQSHFISYANKTNFSYYTILSIQTRNNKMRYLISSDDTFGELKPATRCYIEEVYSAILALKPGNEPGDSYYRLKRALLCLGADFCNHTEASVTAEFLIGQMVYQLDSKVWTAYDGSDFELRRLNAKAFGRDWGLNDLKIIATRWMGSKNEEQLLVKGKRVLARYKRRCDGLRERLTVDEAYASTLDSDTANYKAHRSGDGSARQRGKAVRAAKTVPPLNEKTQPLNSPSTTNRDNETVRCPANDNDAFHKLQPATQRYIEEVYITILELQPGSELGKSYDRLFWALHCLGVGTFAYTEASITAEFLIAQMVHQEWLDSKFWTAYDDSDFDLQCLTEKAEYRQWDSNDLKIIAAKWMSGKDEERLLIPGRKFLAIHKDWCDGLKARRTEKKVSASTCESYTADYKARRPNDGGPKHRGEAERADKAVSPIHEKTQPLNNPSTLYMDVETLRLIKRVRVAHDATAKQTFELVAHLLGSQRDRPSNVPPHKRIEAPQPVDYPWRKKDKGRDPKRRGGRP